MDIKKQILVVDDNPDVLTLLLEILSFMGYSVITTNHPSLATVKCAKIDLVILDLDLSGGTTIEGHKFLASLWVDRLFDTPIIIYSGHIERDEEKRNIERITEVLGNGRNFFKCIPKGGDFKDLLDAIEECFQSMEILEHA
jgi:CheY-like chemotaxis protein